MSIEKGEKMKKESMTASITAFARYYHHENVKEPIFSDCLASGMLTKESLKMIPEYMILGYDFLKEEGLDLQSNEDKLNWIVHHHLAPTPIGRSRFTEDALKLAIQLGVTQYVILGAGYDTFAFREPNLLDHIKVFELDHPFTQIEKLKRIKEMKLIKHHNHCFISMDFEVDQLKDVLLEGGFDPKALTFVSWLGVTYYLELNVIQENLMNLSEILCQGSSLVFDYSDEKIVNTTSQRALKMMAMAEQSGEKMKSFLSYSQINQCLDHVNMAIYEHLSPEQIQARFFDSSQMNAFEHIHYIHAVKQKY